MTDIQNISSKEIVSVGDFFEMYNVCIPILQRDYAQGRAGKERVREMILNEIKGAVEGDKELTLDFIYGYKESDESNVFYPLDGQQRLTTLWLVYWYLALRAGKSEKEKNTLLKFTYKTRKSSREFCRKLCKQTIENKDGIVDYIENQKWFFSSWKKDPTVNAMLRMLGGTNGSDGIEPLFRGIAEGQSEWKRYLKNFKKNIKFCVLEIDDKKLPRKSAEQLYVKMNARGKALTDFENFKADLVNMINELFKNDDKNGEKISLTRKLDTDWNDIFWDSVKAGQSDGKTDEVFFAFINRFCFSQLCLKKEKEQSSYLLKPTLIRKIDEILDINADRWGNNKKIADVSEEEKEALSLYSYFSLDNDIKYKKYDYYTELLDRKNLKKLESVLDRIKKKISDTKAIYDVIKEALEHTSEVVSQREKTNYHFLPAYKKMKNGEKETRRDDNGNKVGIVEETNLKERIYFFAICKYFENNDSYKKDSFEEWLRFCRNVIENSGVDSVAAMISVIRRLNETADYLSNYKTNQDDEKTILDYLSSLSDERQDDGDELLDSSEKTKINEQIDEEIRKAKKIKEDVCWKEKIRKAENTLFLCGKISFLFTDGNGQENWDCFMQKLSKIKSDFEGGKASLEFVRNYARSYKDFYGVREKLIFHNKGWQRRGDSWLDILTGGEYEKVHKALMGERFDNAEDADGYKSFVESKTFKFVVAKESVFKGKKDLRISLFKNSYALYKKRAQNDKLIFDYSSDSSDKPPFLRKFLRNELLKSLTANNEFSLAENQKVDEEEAYYFGDDIYFSCNNKHYVWTSDDSVYIYDKDKGSKIKKESNVSQRWGKAANIQV